MALTFNSWQRWDITRKENGNVKYAGHARHVAGFAVVYVVFGWAAGAIHGKWLMLLDGFSSMTADMNNLTCLYIVISGHHKKRM